MKWKISQGDILGRTIPSFRIALHQEKKQWALFRNALNSKERHMFDQLFMTSKYYIAANVLATKPIRMHSIFMSMLLSQYKKLLTFQGI